MSFAMTAKLNLLEKLLLLLMVISSTTPAFGSHLAGGAITWEAQGNDNYIFTMTLYRECGGFAAPMQNSYSIQGRFAIPVALRGSSVVTPGCYDTSQVPVCGAPETPGYLAMEKYVYRSGVISLPGPIPATGDTFTFNFCCRPVINNMPYSSNSTASSVYLKSVMFEANEDSPEFMGDPEYVLSGAKAVSMMASRPRPGDSLYYEFVPPKIGPSANASFSSGYSFSNPLPSPSYNALNGNVELNNQTGLLSYDIVQPAGGNYLVTIRVQCWREGKLLSEVNRELITTHTNISGNPAPAVVIDTAQYTNLSRQGQHYTAEVVVGDTLDLLITANDQKFHPDTTLQLISLEAQGQAFSPQWGGKNFTHVPQIIPVGQTGLTSDSIHRVRFRWYISPEHAEKFSQKYFFNLRYRDDACPNGKTNISLVVNALRAAYIEDDSLYACEGDSILLDGRTLSETYQWEPAAKVADAIAESSLALADSSGYFYLTDPANPDQTDTVYVIVEPRKTFSLSANQGLLEVTDSVQNGQRMWKYNDIPLYWPYDTLRTFAPGSYHLESQTENCSYTTSTISAQHTNFSVTDPANGDLAQARAITGSMGVAVRFAGSGQLTKVLIPGIKDLQAAAGYDLELKIYNLAQQVVYRGDVSLQSPVNGVVEIPTIVNIQPGKDYMVAVTGDTGFAFSLYENVSVPFMPYNKGLEVVGYSEAVTAGVYPQNITDYVLPFVFQVDNYVGESEEALKDLRIYPNPAQESFRVEHLPEGSEVALMDATGKTLRRFHSAGTEILVHRGSLSKGIYLLQIRYKEGQVSRRLVFE